MPGASTRKVLDTARRGSNPTALRQLGDQPFSVELFYKVHLPHDGTIYCLVLASFLTALPSWLHLGGAGPEEV